MPFTWPTMEQALYRIMRLRRLIALAVALPVVAMLGLSMFDPVALSPDRASLAALAVASLIVGHVVLFPNVTLETISLSIAVTLLVVVMPLIKLVAGWAPEEHVTAALVILMAFGVAATGVVMALLQIALSALVYAGPTIRRKLAGQVFVPCSAAVAHHQFALQPQTRRGRILTGEVDENGFFDVAVASPQHADPQNVDHPLIVRVDAKVLLSTPDQHDVMLVLRNGSVTVTSQRFVAAADGCRVEVADLPGDFTLGMHLVFWLTDQQADNLTELADVITGTDERANGLAHGVSLLSVAGAILSPRAPVENQAE